MKYDYLVVGSGLYGAIFAHEAKSHGKSVLVVDKRPNVAGNIYTENIEGINVHKYGAHIFHTNNKKVWNYITQFAEFNRFTNSPVANYKGELYSLPFNMYTFNKMWGVVTPEEAAAKIEEQRKEITGEPKNLEEQAISLVGRDIYEKLIKGYTEKQWGRDCKEYADAPWQIDSDEVIILHVLAVHPDYRGKGLARRLVENVIEQERKAGKKALRLDVIENNTTAEKLYQKLGFRYIQTKTLYYDVVGEMTFKLYELVL